MYRKMPSLFGFVAAFMAGQSAAQQFQTKDQFEENLVRQTTLTPRTLEILRDYGVSAETELRLEYFFYTDREEKAAALYEALIALGYSGQFARAANDASKFIVTGWSLPVRMSEQAAIDWTEKMVRLGFEHDAEFDGWGTNPQQ